MGMTEVNEQDVTAPDYGTARWAELPYPALVLGVFRPAASGSVNVALFGPLPRSATDEQVEELLTHALRTAESVGGTVVRLAVLADYSGGVTRPTTSDEPDR